MSQSNGPPIPPVDPVKPGGSALTPPPGDQNKSPSNSKLGEWLIGGGALVMVGASLSNRATHGGIIASALFTVICGMIIRYPTLLQTKTGTADSESVSTMRAAVLLVVSVFAILTVKAGWGSFGLDALKIDQSWAWVLGAAFGGKALQSFSSKP